MSELDILTPENAIAVVKENKTCVNYFIFDECEVHLNQIPPHSIQEWHRHKIIDEIVVVTKGEICIKWQENSELKSQIARKNSIVRVKNSIHTITNLSNDWAEFTVFRMVPTGEVKSTIIKKDKEMCEIILR
jgi:quercetin dioxygenase-like cupin family protein